MSNMSYCRFENTIHDLQDCYDNMDSLDNESSEYEIKARKQLIELCIDIASEYGDVDEYKR